MKNEQIKESGPTTAGLGRRNKDVRGKVFSTQLFLKPFDGEGLQRKRKGRKGQEQKRGEKAPSALEGRGT